MATPNPVSLNARFAGRKPVPSGFNFSLPGNLVMYLMMNLLIFGGATVASERRAGIIKRLWIHPITRWELVMGKIYGLMLLGTVQIVFFPPSQVRCAFTFDQRFSVFRWVSSTNMI